MVSSSCFLLTNSVSHLSPTITISEKCTNSQENLSICFNKREPKSPHISSSLSSSSSSHSTSSQSQVLQKLVPLAASVALLFWSNPVHAGILSGSTGLESMPGPQLPEIEFLKRFNEENQKKYAEFDERFKSSPVLKELLERSKLNKEKNKQEIQDKYCLRGAEWGIGDCSTDGMTADEKDSFIAMLKQKIEQNAANSTK